MKYLLITIAAVMLMGCGESQKMAPAPESKPVEPVAEATKPEPPTAKASDLSIHDAAYVGNIEAVKQHLAAGADVNAKDEMEGLLYMVRLLKATRRSLSYLSPKGRI